MTTSRVALVTGASSGFGQATAALLAAQGFQVFGTSRTPARNPAGTYDMLPLDVCSEISVQACIQTILERTGRIDLLVNNVALPMCQPAPYRTLSRSRSPRQSGRVALWDVRRRYAARLQKSGLPAASEADRYGYEIVKLIAERSGGEYELKEATMYSSVRRLEVDGDIEWYWGDESQGGRRKYFRITEKGKATYDHNKSNWEYAKRVLDNLL